MHSSSQQPDDDDREWHAEVVSRVLRGDVRAYTALVERHRNRSLRYAWRMLGDMDEAEDVAQDTFVRAYRSLGRCDDPGNFGGWLFTILANRCRSALAKRVRRKTLFDAHGADTLDEAVSPPTTSDAGIASAVEAALVRLSPAQREVFLMRYVEEMSYEEIARVTGSGLSALKMRVSRARDALRAELGGIANVE